jgi:hypothetical protein
MGCCSVVTGSSWVGVSTASLDLLREMIRGFAQRMMNAEVERLCGAGYGRSARSG